MKNDGTALVGVWRVKTQGAPSRYHMFMFNADGTMLQSNPAEGNKETSDTAGMGVWAGQDGAYKARLEEYKMDYADGTVTRGAIDIVMTVVEDKLSGNCDLTIYDPETGERSSGPRTATLQGERVSLP